MSHHIWQTQPFHKHHPRGWIKQTWEAQLLNKNLEKNHFKLWTLKLHDIDCSSFAFSTNTSAKQSRPLFVYEEEASSQASLSTRKDQSCTSSSILRPLITVLFRFVMLFFSLSSVSSLYHHLWTKANLSYYGPFGTCV